MAVMQHSRPFNKEKKGLNEPEWPPNPSNNLRDAEVACWPHGFLEAWGTEAKKTHFPERVFLFGLAAEGGKAKNKWGFLKNVWLFALLQRASKKPLGQKNTSGSHRQKGE